MRAGSLRRDAYRKTACILAREYPARMAAVAAIAVVVGFADGPVRPTIWVVVIAALLGLEAWLYQFLLRKDAAVGAGTMGALGAISVACNIAAQYPIYVFLHQGTPAAYFAASAYLAGFLINFIVNNGSHPVIFAFAGAPVATAYILAGAYASVEAKNPTALISSVIFVGAALVAYRAYNRNLRRYLSAAAEARKEREIAQQASRAKSQFLAKMSHEIKTPLNGILGMAQAIGADELSQEQKDRLKVIVSAGDELLHLLNTVLDHAAVESGAFALKPASCDIQATVERAAAAYREAAARKGLDLQIETQDLAVPVVVADAARLGQALDCLLSNAVKFTAEGEVRVIARAVAQGKQAHVEILVKDTGIGLDPQLAARVFLPFEQADNSVRRQYGGVGLGLPIARAIIDAMGGRLDAQGDHDGAVFSMSFDAPIADATNVAPQAVAQNAAEHRPDVLVVEDNLVNFQVVSALLKKHARSIEHAENGAVALDRLETRQYDVILMDLHMPVMDGLAATQKIRAAKAPWSKTPIVFLTAAASAENQGAALAHGANGFLGKPINSEILLKTLTSAMRLSPAG